MARGTRDAQLSMLALIDLETRIPADHPVRTIKQLADTALATLSPVFDAMYAAGGRPSIPPERLLKAHLLMALYSIRSERLLCEQLEYHLLYRWFLDMDLVEPGFVPTTFSKNRQRLLKHQVAELFMQAVVQQALAHELLSAEHFTVDGTLIEAAASLKSFTPRTPDGETPPVDDPGNPTVDFKGERRTNQTHASTTDPEARLARKGWGAEARLRFTGHALMENRNGLIVQFTVTEATGTAERDVVPALIEAARTFGLTPATLGADKGYDTYGCVAATEAAGVTPHFARYVTKTHPSAISAETAASPEYALSQRKRKRVEEIFGWLKTTGGLRRSRVRGVARTEQLAQWAAAAYNLVRMATLLGRPAMT